MSEALRIDPKVSVETYERILKRYDQFLENLNDKDKPVIRVFDPLSARQLADLETTRLMSKDLQMKKDADMKKAQEDKEEMEKAKEQQATEVKKQEDSTEEKVAEPKTQ